MRIIISTEKNLRGLFGKGPATKDLQQKLNDSQLSLLEQYGILYFNESTKKFEKEDSDSSIIVIRDNYIVPEDMRFNNNDYLLHHSQTEGHLASIKNKFEDSNRMQGEHNFGKKYDEVFKIILDNKDDKAERIINFLFKTIEIENVEDKSKTTITIQEVQEHYKKFFRVLNHAYLKEKNGTVFSVEVKELKEKANIISKYLKSPKELSGWLTKDTPKGFYEYISVHHFDIEKALFT